MSVEPLQRKPRYSTMRGGGNSDHERRIVALEGKVDAVQNTLKQVQSDTAEILSLVKHTKNLSGMIRRHGPRVIAAAVGYLIATGHMSSQTGQSFLHVLGLS